MSEKELCRPALVRERPWLKSRHAVRKPPGQQAADGRSRKTPKLPLGQREPAVSLCRSRSSYTAHSNQDTHKTTLGAGGLPRPRKVIREQPGAP